MPYTIGWSFSKHIDSAATRKEIEETVGRDIVRVLGQGYYGVVYLLDDGTVAKYTLSTEELNCADMIVEEGLFDKTPHLPVIYSVTSTRHPQYAGIPTGIIHRENLSDLSRSQAPYDLRDFSQAAIDELMDELEADDWDELLSYTEDDISEVVYTYLMHEVLAEEVEALAKVGVTVQDAGKLENWGTRVYSDGSYEVVFRDVSC